MVKSKRKGTKVISRAVYTVQFKTKLALEVLQEEKELGTIAYENGINPNILRNWKRDFFEDRIKTEKQIRRKENQLGNGTGKMLKTICQLTVERFFFRIAFAM